jgi:formylglycine-generating enzyme required for sulfatase activity
MMRLRVISWLPALTALLLLGGAGAALAEEKTNSIGMEFVLIPAGSFTMGADKNFEDAGDNETPAHRVTISKAFYLGKYEVTQAQWVSVMGSNPSYFKGRSNPVDKVSWDEVQSFIKKLNQKEGVNKYRLPTEAEWEYAARAGSTSTYSFGDDAEALRRYAWYGEDYDSGSTHPVGQKEPNGWGLYDMHGNVSEWVQDWRGENYYSGSPGTDPRGPSSGSHRVNRGGGWSDDARHCRSASRNSNVPVSASPGWLVTMPDKGGIYNGGLGFRLAFSPGQ